MCLVMFFDLVQRMSSVSSYPSVIMCYLLAVEAMIKPFFTTHTMFGHVWKPLIFLETMVTIA